MKQMEQIESDEYRFVDSMWQKIKVFFENVCF